MGNENGLFLVRNAAMDYLIALELVGKLSKVTPEQVVQTVYNKQQMGITQKAALDAVKSIWEDDIHDPSAVKYDSSFIEFKQTVREIEDNPSLATLVLYRYTPYALHHCVNEYFNAMSNTVERDTLYYTSDLIGDFMVFVEGCN